MATLAGNTIASTYPLLLKVSSNGLDGTLRAIQDGDATDSVLYLATDSALISGNGTKLYFFDADGDEHISADNAGNLTIGAGVDLNLTATTDINIPVNVGLRFGDGGENIETDNTDLTITSGNDIILSMAAAGSVYPSGDGGDRNTYYGYDSGIALASGGENNVLYGYEAGKALTTGDENVIIGKSAGDVLTSTSNTVLIGKDAGGAIDSTDANSTIAIGHSALKALTSGASNVAVGFEAGILTTTGTRNVYMGWEAAEAGVDASYNVAIGFEAFSTSDVGDNNVAIGNKALQDFDGADNAGSNVAVGGIAMLNSSTAVNSTAVGYRALGEAVTTGDYNVAVGFESGRKITSGDDNTLVGSFAGKNISTGAKNTVVGYEALDDGASLLTGDKNTCVGYQAGELLAGAAAQNTLLGAYAGEDLTTGTRNVCIGHESMTDDATATNQIVIGDLAIGVADNSVTLGHSDITAVYAGSDSGATVHAGSVISNSNYALEGYSTGRNVLRVIKYKFEDATNPNNVKITATSLFNGDAVAAADNVSTSAVSNYNFQASFGELRVGYANFTGNVVGIISCESLRNTTGTDMMVQVNNSAANSRIEVYFRNRTSGAELNMEDLVDSGYLEVSLAYITSS